VLARAWRDRGDLEVARTEIERFLGVEPDHEPALRLAVECALRLGDPLRALERLRDLVRLDPGDRGAHGQLRALEVAAGWRGPDTDMGGVWPLLHDDTFATVTFGDLCRAQGLLDEAIAVFSRIRLRHHDHDAARERLAELGEIRAQARRPRG
jgi:uncharacterized protein HemY